MLEALLLTGKPLPLLEWSGPGNKRLRRGDETLGYFGIVSESELYSSQDVLNFGVLTTAEVTELGGLTGWLKFIKDGRIIYIRQSPLISGVSWLDLYQRGLIYGSRDEGATPLLYDGVNQFVSQRFDENGTFWTLKLRSMTGYNDLVSDSVTDDTSEWVKLLSNVISTSDNGTGLFSSFDYDSNYTINGQILANRNLSGDLMRSRGTNGLNGSATPTLSTSEGYVWTPVIELVPSSEIVYGPGNVDYTISATTSSVFFTNAETIIADATLKSVTLKSVDYSTLTEFTIVTENTKVIVSATAAESYGTAVTTETVDTVVSVTLTGVDYTTLTAFVTEPLTVKDDVSVTSNVGIAVAVTATNADIAYNPENLHVSYSPLSRFGIFFENIDPVAIETVITTNDLEGFYF